MKRLHRWAILVLLVSSFCIMLAACGSGKSDINTEQFSAPIVEYLKARSYGMQVVSFTGAEASEGKTTVTCKMKDSEGLYAIAVTWEFVMVENAGSWTVEKHVQK